MKDVGKCYGHSVYFTAISYILCMAIWYTLWSLWYIFPVLVCCAKKNLATLHSGAAILGSFSQLRKSQLS
jgi:hypothetical protein